MNLNLSLHVVDKTFPTVFQWRTSEGAHITIIAKNIIGRSRKMVTEANVSPNAPKQPQSTLRPCKNTMVLAMKKDKLSRPIPKADNRV
ncbi:MAG: hypothetical protein ACXVAD_11095, partial [Syntrophales bacterium]